MNEVVRENMSILKYFWHHRLGNIQMHALKMLCVFFCYGYDQLQVP